MRTMTHVADAGTCVCAVLVTHQPALPALQATLAALAPQVAAIDVIDNASADTGALHALCAARPRVTLHAQAENLGLAHAQNLGIAAARARPGITHVLLLDQDSVPQAGMVAALLDAIERLRSTGKVAAVGPRFRDPREHADAPFVRIRFPFNRKLRCDGSCTEIRCDFLIASGCLIPLAVLDEVGDMDASLFIDNVDLDWCFRASARGYALHGVCGAHLAHHLGDARQRVAGLPRGIIVHPPARLYYMMRNRVLLYRRAYTPRRWIAQDVPRLAAKFALFALLVAPRRANMRAMLGGLRAGIAGRTGHAPP